MKLTLTASGILEIKGPPEKRFPVLSLTTGFEYLLLTEMDDEFKEMVHKGKEVIVRGDYIPDNKILVSEFEEYEKNLVVV